MATWSNDGSSLTSQQWRQAEEIFLNALELPPHSRREYVAQSRDVDDVVRAQVNLLLAGHEVPDGPLKSTDGNCDLSSPIRDPLPIPALIGPYRLLELIGRGGMGAVFRAERADGHFQKQVAIKLINPEMLSPRSIERFRAERQMLAALEHPGVTRMLDGGSGRDGQHYIVMEYIEGVSVTRFCLDKSLSTRKIVQLFLQVCSAVQFVHSHGIVHRDLKPGNILVTPDGTVKLLDFGISRLQFDPATASPRPAQDFLREESRHCGLRQPGATAWEPAKVRLRHLLARCAAV